VGLPTDSDLGSKPPCARPSRSTRIAIPSPGTNGSRPRITLLCAYVNLAERDFNLTSNWVTAAVPSVAPNPILILNGEQSSGDTALARIVRWLIDPRACPDSGGPIPSGRVA
jgi:hypothetical protein